MKHFCSFGEAMREGAKLAPQYFGSSVNEERTATCAYGAGVHAIVGTLDAITFETFDPFGAYPYLLTLHANCPADDCDQKRIHLFLMIFHLNDHHQWGREAIADWLEKEEEKIGYVTLSVESEYFSESLQRAVISV